MHTSRIIFLMAYNTFVLSKFFTGVPGPILKFKESIQNGQKGHPTLVTQVNLIL